MKKTKIIFIAISFLILFNPATSVIATPALPPQVHPTEPPEPIPPPDVSEEPKPPEGSPAPTPFPTPTPCIPSLCEKGKETICCIEAACIQVGPYKLCNRSMPKSVTATSQSNLPAKPSFFSRFLEFLRSIF
jgi:hypothetical protein